MVVDDEFQPQPCLIIYYTNCEILEGLSWCELHDLVKKSHSILVWKVDVGLANFDHTHDSKTGCGDRFGAYIPIQPSLTIH